MNLHTPQAQRSKSSVVSLGDEHSQKSNFAFRLCGGTLQILINFFPQLMTVVEFANHNFIDGEDPK